MGDSEFEFLLSVDDFDKSQLPEQARDPRSPQFAAEVSKIIERDYAPFEGHLKIVVDAATIHVRWTPGTLEVDPIGIAIGHLRKGDYAKGVSLLRTLRKHQPNHPDILYNLGMALSDLGELDEACPMLEKLVGLTGDSYHLVAYGVALTRAGHKEKAAEVLRAAVKARATNPYAHRNLGGVLLQLGNAYEGFNHLRRATELAPDDANAWYGRGQAAEAMKDHDDADKAYSRVLQLQPHGEVAELARSARSRIGAQNFRANAGNNIRPDAMMYCLGALQRFKKLPAAETQRIAFEVAMLGRNGLDVNDPAQKYTLKTIPGNFSGLHLVCLMYVGFKQIAPDQDVGFDLAAEYCAALAMFNAQA